MFRYVAQALGKGAPHHGLRWQHGAAAIAAIAAAAGGLTADFSVLHSAHAEQSAPHPASLPQGAAPSNASPGIQRQLKEGADFQAYDAAGRPVPLEAVVAAFGGVDAVLLGEYHDDAVAHRLELQLLRDAHRMYHQPFVPNAGHGAPAAQPVGPRAVPAPTPHAMQHAPKVQATNAPPSAPHRPRRLILSLEMFERDVQCVVDEFLSGSLPERDLVRDGRAWPNYHSDYAPLLGFAKARGLAVVAANAPRRYVSIAGRQGEAARALVCSTVKRVMTVSSHMCRNVLLHICS